MDRDRTSKKLIEFIKASFATTAGTEADSESERIILHVKKLLERLASSTTHAESTSTIARPPDAAASTREHIAGDQAAIKARLLQSQLEAALESEALEDGTTHPGETILQKAIIALGDRADPWINQLVWSNGEVSTSASILKIAGRCGLPIALRTRQGIVARALQSQNIEIRDAALHACELWEDPRLIETIRSHNETVGWLASYRDQVIADLTL